jgi:hypothetical protein
MIIKTEQPNGKIGLLLNHGDRILIVQPTESGLLLLQLATRTGYIDFELQPAEVAHLGKLFYDGWFGGPESHGTRRGS